MRSTVLIGYRLASQASIISSPTTAFHTMDTPLHSVPKVHNPTCANEADAAVGLVARDVIERGEGGKGGGSEGGWRLAGTPLPVGSLYGPCRRQAEMFNA